jgi:hypothetical protein
MCSWLIVLENGERKVVDSRAKGIRNVRAAARRAIKAGRVVLAAWEGKPGPAALCRKVFPEE